MVTPSSGDILIDGALAIFVILILAAAFANGK